MIRSDPVRLDQPQIHPETLAAWSSHLGAVVGGPAGLRARLGEGDLPSAMARAARHRPQAPALDIGARSMTHGELDRAAALAASSFHRLGVGPGGTVLLIAENSMTSVIAYLGALRVGAALVLANPSSTSIELDQMADDAGAELLVGSGAALEAAIRVDVSSVREVIGLAEDDRGLSSGLLDDIHGEPVDIGPIDPESPAILGFTSGTTGRSKCAPLSHRNLLASIRGVMWAWRWSEGEHLVHSLPISHQHGLGGIHATLLAGSRATVLERFDSELILATVVDRGATAMFAVPSVHERLLRDLGRRASGLGRLRFATSGSAPLPVDLALRVEDTMGQLPLERYGSTEAGLDISNPLQGRRIPGSVGLALPGIELAVVADSGEAAPTGEPGEILIRGPQVFAGYRGVEPGGTFLFDWFRTGDIGLIDAESGYLRVVGRSKELIISGGMNVYPREVEDVLRTGRGVEDAAVIGVPSERWGEEVVAFVAPADVDMDLLAELAAGALAPYKRPKRILAVDLIPRSVTGKAINADLVQAASADAGWSSPPAGI